MYQQLQEKLDAFVQTYTQTNGNGGHLRVTVKDEIIYEKFIGFANIENKIPFKQESMFTIYSISKPFCAIGLLKLKDKNLVDIDKHPGVYLPEAKGFDQRVTIRQLLYHISGLPDFSQDTDFATRYPGGGGADFFREKLLELQKYPLLFEPGTKGKYANINYILCALIIENVSGLSYADYMKKEVFEPLGMPFAQIDSKDLILENRVQGYTKQEGKIVPVERVSGWNLGAADVVATVEDVYCLNKAIKNQLLLKPETWDEVFTPSPINSMGMGCTVSEWHGKKRITHGGGWEGFRTLHIQLPEDDFDIILLSNSAWGDAREDYSEAIYDAYFGTDTLKSDKVAMDVGYI